MGTYIRKLLALLLLPASLWATTTVTGHITDLSGTAATSNTFARFTLRGCSGNQPRVNGTAIFAPTQGGTWYKDFPADSSGNISGTIYSSRDSTGLLGGDITCGTSNTGVWYGLSIWQGGKSGPEIAVHAKSGSTLDVTQVTPITTNPVIAAPTGDSTYLRKDASNSPLTGNLSSTGTISDTGGSHSGAETFTGPLNSTNTINGSSINGTFWVCPVPCIYTTLAPALTAAVAVGGGLIFDMVPETFTTNPMAVVPVTATVTIQFGNGVWLTNQQIDLPQFSRMIGAGEWNGTGGTAIRANPAAFPSQTITTCTESSFTATCNVTSTANIAVNSMVSIGGNSVAGYNQSCIATTVTTNTIQCLVKTSGLGTGNGGTLSAAIIRIGRDNQTHGAFVTEMTLDCQNLASACSGISSSDANEYSGARDISIQNFGGYGIDIESTVGGSAQNNYWQNVEITPGNGGNANTIGFRYVGNGGGCPANIFNVNVVGTPGHVIDRGFLLANCVGGVGFDMHTEYAANAGVQLGDATLGAAGNFALIYPTYGNGSGTTNVLINNTSTTNIPVLAASKGTATNNIVDNSNSFTSTEAAVAYYSFGQGAVGSRQIITSSAQLPNITYATTHLGGDVFKVGSYFTETSALAAGAGLDACYGDSTTHAVKCSYNNGTFFQIPQVIASGTATMTTAAITAPACGTTVIVAATGVAATDTITWAFNAAPAGTNAGLVAWPTAGNVNFAYCPGVTETPAAATINWRVVR